MLEAWTNQWVPGSPIELIQTWIYRFVLVENIFRVYVCIHPKLMLYSYSSFKINLGFRPRDRSHWLRLEIPHYFVVSMRPEHLHHMHGGNCVVIHIHRERFSFFLVLHVSLDAVIRVPSSSISQAICCIIDI